MLIRDKKTKDGETLADLGIDSENIEDMLIEMIDANRVLLSNLEDIKKENGECQDTIRGLEYDLKEAKEACDLYEEEIVPLRDDHRREKNAAALFEASLAIYKEKEKELCK